MGFLFPVGLALVLLALIIILLLRNERIQQERRLIEEHRQVLGLPDGDLVYENSEGQGDLLTSDQYILAGKPDFVIKLADGRLVPIEQRLAVRNVTTPQRHHELQVAAYCLILEEYSEQMPTHGILRYADRDFTIDYTKSLRKKVISSLEKMAACDQYNAPDLQKQTAAKCRACTFKPICPIGRDK